VRRRFAGVALMLIGIGSAGLLLVPRARAQTLSSFTVSARADAATVGIIDTHAPLVVNGQLVDATPATAQALVDSLGESQGFASAPYAGDFLVNVPNIVNGLFNGKAPPLPSYPFIVNSSYPGSPSGEQVQGPYGMTARSTPTNTSATARLGLLTGTPAVVSATATSTASQDATTGALVAQADTEIVGLSLGPLLKIGKISAHAQMTALPGQTPVKQSSFSVGTLTIAGIEVGITDKGLQVGPTTVPFLKVSALTHLLAASGVKLSYLPSAQTASSMESAGLSVAFTQNVPTQGPVTVTLTFGRVATTTDSAGGSPAVGSAPAGNDTGTASPVASIPTITAPVSSNGGTTPPPVLSATTSRPLAAPRLARRRPSQQSAAMGPWQPILGPKATGIYLAMIGGGVLVLAGARALGKVGSGLPVVTEPPAGTAAGPVLRLPPS
jgi:hypothetical protein